MKNKSFTIYTLFLLLILATNAFSQFREKATLDGLTRPRVSEKVEKTEKNLSVSGLEKFAFELINKERAAKNLEALTWKDDLAKVARLHSQNMADGNFFNHRGLDGSMVNDRANSLGVKRWQAIGENIAFNQGYENPAEFAVECWLESSAHRKNLLNVRWQETGIGIAVAANGAYYFTQVFLERK
jgi:uncharacterized protein YkwD